MGFEDFLEKLNRNPKEDAIEAVRLLVRIAENIINDPRNVSYRTLKKSNPTISKKILQVSGAVLCLKLMGFQENETSFVLPAEVKLTGVYDAKDTLLMWKESVELSDSSPNADPVMEHHSSSSGNSRQIGGKPLMNRPDVPKQEIIKPIVLPPLNQMYNHPFFHKIELNFHNCLRYANKDVQERARKLIPVVTLERSAQKRLRAIQEHVKKSKLSDPNISVQDMLILELLQWFKEDFFSWVNSPDCENCGGKTHFSHYSHDKALLVYTNRVELHRCESCHRFTPFARYDDLNILLETRKGRCGEWANVFTLLCCAMGWDARFVLDENDHVWTEVYSIAQNRWLHCDPCENICDKPLIYESGWKKKMTYIIAYSSEEVQDVTWRYSSHYREVLERRKSCDERKLIEVLMELRKKRQVSFSQPRRDYLTKRLVLELADMLIEKKPGEGEDKGRESGDAVWRLARGEIQEESSTEFIWQIDPDSLVNNTATVRYSAASDNYEVITGGTVKTSRKKWTEGCFSHKNILRKEEKDWKKVYLARKGNDVGHVSWSFAFPGDSKKQLDTVILQFGYTTFENGTVEAKIRSDDICELIPGDSGILQTNRFTGKRNITVEATLSGGKGDVAWQHTQLFRQPLDGNEFPFSITFLFK